MLPLESHEEMLACFHYGTCIRNGAAATLPVQLFASPQVSGGSSFKGWDASAEQVEKDMPVFVTVARQCQLSGSKSVSIRDTALSIRAFQFNMKTRKQALQALGHLVHYIDSWKRAYINVYHLYTASVYLYTKEKTMTFAQNRCSHSRRRCG